MLLHDILQELHEHWSSDWLACKALQVSELGFASQKKRTLSQVLDLFSVFLCLLLWWWWWWCWKKTIFFFSIFNPVKYKICLCFLLILYRLSPCVSAALLCILDLIGFLFWSNEIRLPSGVGFVNFTSSLHLLKEEKTWDRATSDRIKKTKLNAHLHYPSNNGCFGGEIFAIAGKSADGIWTRYGED